MKLARVADPRFHAALDKLAKEALPAKVAFRLKGAIKTVKEEYNKYEEVRNASLNKHGKKDEAGNLILSENQSVEFEKEAFQEFVKDMGLLANEEVTIPTIKLSEVPDSLNLTLEEVELLDGFIVED